MNFDVKIVATNVIYAKSMLQEIFKICGTICEHTQVQSRSSVQYAINISDRRSISNAIWMPFTDTFKRLTGLSFSYKNEYPTHY